MKNTKQLILIIIVISCVFSIIFRLTYGGKTELPRPENEPNVRLAGSGEREQRHAGVVTPLNSKGRPQVFTNPDEAPGWTVRYGGEFWHDQGTNPGKKIQTSDEAPFDLGSIISRVSHAIRDVTADGFPAIQAKTYTGIFGLARHFRQVIS